MAWVEALEHNRHWDEDVDRPRFVPAFKQIAATASTWPTPQEFFEAMPPRPQQKALPKSIVSEEKARENMDRIARMLRGEE